MNVTWKQYVDQRFKDIEKQSNSALNASKEAITKAEKATEKRFDAANEFRQALSDQTSTFITRLESDTHYKVLEDKIEQLRVTSDINAGRSDGFSQGWSIFIAAITLFLGIVYLIVRAK